MKRGVNFKSCHVEDNCFLRQHHTFAIGFYQVLVLSLNKLTWRFVLAEMMQTIFMSVNVWMIWCHK